MSHGEVDWKRSQGRLEAVETVGDKKIFDVTRIFVKMNDDRVPGL